MAGRGTEAGAPQQPLGLTDAEGAGVDRDRAGEAELRRRVRRRRSGRRRHRLERDLALRPTLLLRSRGRGGGGAWRHFSLRTSARRPARGRRCGYGDSTTALRARFFARVRRLRGVEQRGLVLRRRLRRRAAASVTGSTLFPSAATAGPMIACSRLDAANRSVHADAVAAAPRSPARVAHECGRVEHRVEVELGRRLGEQVAELGAARPRRAARPPGRSGRRRRASGPPPPARAARAASRARRGWRPGSRACGPRGPSSPRPRGSPGAARSRAGSSRPAGPPARPTSGEMSRSCQSATFSRPACA